MKNYVVSAQRGRGRAVNNFCFLLSSNRNKLGGFQTLAGIQIFAFIAHISYSKRNFFKNQKNLFKNQKPFQTAVVIHSVN